ncbi:MAG: GNAT family N-acetyltransferase [Deltaproteobacteria bacterium]|nr:GNAT family N-acetyltransferase [Deltaproteobacteria bacterium]
MQQLRAFEHAIATWSPDYADGPCVDPAELLDQAERLLRPGAPELAPEAWHAYLDRTRATRFLTSLADSEARVRWAESAFEAIHRSDYSLEIMIEQRVRAHGSRVFLREARTTAAWTYEQSSRRIQAIATVLQSAAPRRHPKVAILSENCVDSALTDLACLAYDIFVTPLDVHFDVPTIAWIFDRLELNLVVCGNPQLAERLEEAKTRVRHPFRILHLNPDARNVADGDMILPEACSRIGPDDIACHLGGRQRRPLDAPATTMFTSGSTGKPKGVVFTSLNLLTKRFARGAALPKVGDLEVLLCYLPLFHTFGRYLELMGSLYWGGTYVFAGNPSSENLISLLQDVRPTGLISIPLRWVQVRDECLRRVGASAREQEEHTVVRNVVGERLRWGLSAAGHLDPRIFRFFNRHGIELCSGFGMTEATGGITMTPPGEYVDETVGIPLPGVQCRLTDIGELQISGHYVARYLEDPDDPVETGPWLATGDLFRRHDNGYLEIVDRVKDIYKNSKGQTIAPRRVESQFTDVPGIKRVFLAGDGREYNTLLIVPDRGDPVLQAFNSEDKIRAYLHQIIATANQALARYERVVNFTVLTRDFELEQGELTPKGSYRRKTIEEHFAAEIRDMYRGRQIEMQCGDLRVMIPRWFFRDQGWLDGDIGVDDEGLVARGHGRRLRIARVDGGRRVRLGDLEYVVGGDLVDLGLFARQPVLWTGNPQMLAFCPCKDGWDLALGKVSPQVFLPPERRQEVPGEEELTDHFPDYRLARAHDLSARAMFGSGAASIGAIEQLTEMLQRAHDRLASVIRRRLEALARHPELEVRCLAYRTLLLDTLVPESSKVLPSFVEAGLPFLNEESIEIIARANLERRRLEAFRQRLYRYRTELAWPATDQVRAVFADILKLLADFVRYHPDYFPEASLELNAWILHDADPALARIARDLLDGVTRWWEEEVLSRIRIEAAQWRRRLVLHDSLSGAETERLAHLLSETSFLQKSIMVAFEGAALDPAQIPDEGVWVSRLGSLHQRPMYRVSVNTIAGKHYDLLVMLVDHLDHAQVLQTIRWMMAVSAYPFGPAVVPRFGWYDQELHALSLAYIQELTTYERVREFASYRAPTSSFPGTSTWRKLFIRSMAVFFTGWRNSGCRVVPGPLTPSNVVVLEPDFREGAIFLSMAEWKLYESPMSIVRPLVYNFYQQTASHHPWCKHLLDPAWILDACVEAVGIDMARPFLLELRDELEKTGLRVLGRPMLPVLDTFLSELASHYYVQLPLRCAIERYQEWWKVNPEATQRAREQFVEELALLYSIEKFPEIARYRLFRETYFARTEAPIAEAFDRLLDQLTTHPHLRATAMVELSELQAAIRNPEDRSVFTRMAFPHAAPEQRLEVLAVGCERKHVIVRSHVTDHEGATYTVREPVDASEVGKLYRLYVLAGFPKTISARNCFYVALDNRDEIIGGIIFMVEDTTVVHLNGIVVNVQLKGRGLSTALLEDFCRRMADQGIEVVRTFFFVRRFFTQHGFKVDRRWGGLVRFLKERSTDDEHERGQTVD